MTNMPDRINNPMPITPQLTPVIKKMFLISARIIPFSVRSMSIGIMMPGAPLMMPEIRRADVIALVRSAGFGDMEAAIPQNGTSLMV